jgi:6-pyruvoyl-tetrahydropterin synthase
MSDLFVKKLTVIDFSFLCPERGLLGESWQVDIKLTGSLDHQGMVLDFSDVKLVVPKNHEGCKTEVSGKRIKNIFTLSDGRKIQHIAPESAYCFLNCMKISPDAMASAIIEKLNSILPDNIEQVEIKLYPELIEGAYYHYSHGLKHHGGNCQRIAHGHRSRIDILEDGIPRDDLEKNWALKWKDIYIGTRSDIYRQYSEHGTDYIHFRYTACQGLFELIIPANCCYLVDIDTTVENLAEHIAGILRETYPAKTLTVYAYEGIDKGAISNTA